MRKLDWLVLCLSMFLMPLICQGQQWYYGELHGHTNLSDGYGTVGHYFRYARDTSGLEFTAVTDHDYSLDSTKWAAIKDTA
ncbi:MAG: hypothetical protein QME74_07100, partial [Candidatus Edwardsbacteria bacterium]|nr:hypothetical protein [Candidatus Edwardsbacteria bacterium]